MRGRWEVSDAQWKLLEPILRPKVRRDGRGRPWHDTRAVLNGVLWVLGRARSGEKLPSKYPPFQTCHRRFQQWVREGKLERVLRRWPPSWSSAAGCMATKPSSTPPSQERKGGLVIRWEYHAENFLGMVRLGRMKIMLRYL